MPVRYGKTKRVFRRKPKKSYKAKPTRTLAFKVGVNVGRGMPKKMTMTHKYSERSSLVNVTGTPSTIGVVEYYTNNMFRVNKTTGAVHQPLYFDQMMLIYNTFTVIGSKIRVTFIGADSNLGGSNGNLVGIFINDKVTAIAPTLTSTMVEQTGAKNGLLPPDNSTKLVRTYTWSAKKRHGGSILGNSDLQGSNTASPTEVNTYVLFQQDWSKTTGTTIKYMVEIEYICVWSGLRDVTGS